MDAVRNTGRVVAEVGADVLLVAEVEDRPTLDRFNQHVLGEALGGQPYPFNLLIDGNDPRGIDIGILSRHPITSVRPHLFDPDPAHPTRPLFSRDCPSTRSSSGTRPWWSSATTSRARSTTTRRCAWPRRNGSRRSTGPRWSAPRTPWSPETSTTAGQQAGRRAAGHRPARRDEPPLLPGRARHPRHLPPGTGQARLHPAPAHAVGPGATGRPGDAGDLPAHRALRHGDLETHGGLGPRGAARGPGPVTKKGPPTSREFRTGGWAKSRGRPQQPSRR
ncbi:endonuclease/exonuclease/phosphatase family protein [Streptomyces sp. NPDC020192]|uniref:endonuclease/exonuclease/phosphatase family protein n=1 Tax=Streptomyces sp. NPDC020192 TaxID=3365066 RepID=UPI00379C30C4